MEETAADATGLAKDVKAAVSPGELFQLNRNRQPKDAGGSRLNLSHDVAARVIDDAHTRVCERSVFHLPVVYDDLQQISRDLQRLFHPTSSSSGSEFCAFLNQFISQKWIPKVKMKAQVGDHRSWVIVFVASPRSPVEHHCRLTAIPGSEVPQLGHDDAASNPV